MKPRFAIPTVLVAAALALTFGTVLAHGRRGGPGARHLEWMAERLELTTEQRERIREIVARRQEGDLGRALEAAGAARQELRRVVHDPEADEKAVRQAARRAAQAEEDLAVERHAMRAEIRDVLTPEQQERARELRSEAESRRAERHARRHEGFDGAR